MREFMRALCCLTLVWFSSNGEAATVNHFGIEMADAGDLNGDTHRDLLSVAAVDGKEIGLYAIDGVTGAKLWFASGFTNNYFAYEFTPVTAIDSIDGDKIQDIALGIGKDGMVFFLSGKDGSVIDKMEGPSGQFGTSLLALKRDLDGDGIHELLVGAPTSYGAYCESNPSGAGQVFAVSSAKRTILWKRDAPPGGSNFGWALTVLQWDYDNDNKEEVLVSDNCRKNGTSRGAVYILSSATGQILKTVTNPTSQANWQNVMFGYSVLATDDLDGDGVRDYFVGAPNIYGLPGTSAVDLISGATGELICHYVTPAGDEYDGFGAWLAGGRFMLGSPANSCSDPHQGPSGIPHDLLVGSPDYPQGTSVGRAYLLRIHEGACTELPLLTFDNSVPSSSFGNRVGVIEPPWEFPCNGKGGYADLLINSDDDPYMGEGTNDGRGSIRRYSGKDGSFKTAYVAP
jgi:hypothetical protein